MVVWYNDRKREKTRQPCSCFTAWFCARCDWNWNARSGYSVATPRVSTQLCFEPGAACSRARTSLTRAQLSSNRSGAFRFKSEVFESCDWSGRQVNTQWGRTKCFMSVQSEHTTHDSQDWDRWCAVTSASLRRAVIRQLWSDATRAKQTATSAFRWKNPLNGLNHYNNPI